MNKLTSLPVWQQYALGAALLFPWVAFGVLTTDLLPESWQFDTWPAIARVIALVLFGAFVIADVVFAIWFWFDLASKDKTA